MTTQAEFETWLKSSHGRRTVLVEAVARVGVTETTFYMTNRAYNTGAADAPANTHYRPIITGGVTFNEALNVLGFDGPGSSAGAARFATGAFILQNRDGALDGWLGYVWANRVIRVYMGDPTWSRADFYPIFNGIIDDIKPSGREALSLTVTDKLQRLNSPISEVKIGGAGIDKDTLLPVCFGECHNAEPVLTAAATHDYAFHVGQAEVINEARDNGVPVNFSSTLLGTGKVRLLQSPTNGGTITLSVQGDKSGGVYTDRIGPIIQRIVTGFGKATERFLNADLDLANLTAFNAANPQCVGLYSRDRVNVLEACNILAASVGAQIAMSRASQLRIHKVELPPSGAPRDIKRSDYEQFSLSIKARSLVRGAVKLGYCRNWAVQSNLQTGIPEAHKELYGKEYLTATATDAGTIGDWKLVGDPEEEDTLLNIGSEAQSEANRRRDLWKVPRHIYEVVCLPHMLTLELGQPVRLFGNRFGMEAGKVGMVTALDSNWLDGRVRVEVLA
ncbi:hypothetical protein [Cupriavidus nantongensis]|uniref:Tip attachment protein J domain-containing protein n=1 Tax=Cupriavidus nantongensis TaxID=1796606 RepID=A0A142JHX2_9BURK|nr:hypothetical protein [Cupriavidus nantongensis]AMR77684.1 hypothetical protein A2G96_08015 [Cupriavidus nantongensis]